MSALSRFPLQTSRRHASSSPHFGNAGGLVPRSSSWRPSEKVALADHFLTIEICGSSLSLCLARDGGLVETHYLPLKDAYELVHTARVLFQSGHSIAPPPPIRLLSYGEELGQRLLGPLRGPLLGLHGRLWIVSSQAEWLELPLELIPRTDCSFLTQSMDLCIRRASRPPQTAAQPPTDLDPSDPLRVLFVAGAFPAECGYSASQEQTVVTRLTGSRGIYAELTVARSGSISELAELVSEHSPHVVHFSGQVSMQQGSPRFHFRGARAPVAVDVPSLTSSVFAERGVEMVIVSGIETSPGATSALCHALTRSGAAPLALGWALPISDCLATPFMQHLYTRLSLGMEVDTSLGQARDVLLTDCLNQDWNGHKVLYPDFALPRLYAASTLERLQSTESLPSHLPPLDAVAPYPSPDRT